MYIDGRLFLFIEYTQLYILKLRKCDDGGALMAEMASGKSEIRKGVGKKIFLVNRDFQLRYTGAAVIVGLTSTMLTIFLILFPLYRFEILRIPKFLPLPILLIMAMAAVVNISLVGMMGIIITHKMAGPMYSMVRHIRRIESGIWNGQMRLRKGDELGYVVRNFNDMIESLGRIAKTDLESLDRILANLEQSSVDSASLESARRDLQDLRETIAKRIASER